MQQLESGMDALGEKCEGGVKCGLKCGVKPGQFIESGMNALGEKCVCVWGGGLNMSVGECASAREQAEGEGLVCPPLNVWIQARHI